MAVFLLLDLRYRARSTCASHPPTTCRALRRSSRSDARERIRGGGPAHAVCAECGAAPTRAVLPNGYGARNEAPTTQDRCSGKDRRGGSIGHGLAGGAQLRRATGQRRQLAASRRRVIDAAGGQELDDLLQAIGHVHGIEAPASYAGTTPDGEVLNPLVDRPERILVCLVAVTEVV